MARSLEYECRLTSVERQVVSANNGWAGFPVLERSVPERPVGLVEDQGDVVASRERGEGGDFRGRDRDAARVARCDQHDRAGARGDERFGVRGAGDQAGVRFEVHRPDTAHPQPHVVVEVVRQGCDHLVARPGERVGDQAERLVAAGGDDHVRRLDGARVVAGQLVGDRSAQRRDAGHRCVRGAVRCPRDLDDPLDDLRCRWVRRRRLGQVEQRAFGAAGDVAFGEQRQGCTDRRVDAGRRRGVESHRRGRPFRGLLGPRAAYGPGGGFFVAVKPCGRSASSAPPPRRRRVHLHLATTGSTGGARARATRQSSREKATAGPRLAGRHVRGGLANTKGGCCSSKGSTPSSTSSDTPSDTGSATTLPRRTRRCPDVPRISRRRTSSRGTPASHPAR